MDIPMLVFLVALTAAVLVISYYLIRAAVLRALKDHSIWLHSADLGAEGRSREEWIPPGNNTAP